MSVEFFRQAGGHPGPNGYDLLEATARRAEGDGWTGLTVGDSQSLSGDCYVALAMACRVTSTLRLTTGVTNPITRHAAITASAIASIDVASGGRAELGIGRGDSALAYIGLAPAPVSRLATYLDMLLAYLRGDGVPLSLAADSIAHRLGSGLPLEEVPGDSQLKWLSDRFPGRRPVPVFVTASGPEVIKMAASRVQRLTLAVGADPRRVGWGAEIARSVNPDVRLGAYVVVVVDDDVARGVGVAAGQIAAVARFSAMHGQVQGPLGESQRALLEQVSSNYQMTHHGQSQNQAAQLAGPLAEQFAIIGPASYCRDRLSHLAELGVDRFHILGVQAGADADQALHYEQAFATGVIGKGL
jgi:5,10-methylenetetrahydromethanopterin reductase